MEGEKGDKGEQGIPGEKVTEQIHGPLLTSLVWGNLDSVYIVCLYLKAVKKTRCSSGVWVGFFSPVFKVLSQNKV